MVFDVGGTNLRAGVFHVDGSRLERVIRRRTPSVRTLPGAGGGAIREALFAAMADMVREICPDSPPAIISVGFPGPIDSAGGVLSAPTIWGDDRSEDPIPIAARLGRLWPGVRVHVINDMIATGYRYLDSPDADFCIVTVSSGVGHKVFLGGRPVTGPSGRGGEIGHWRLDLSPDAPRCDCGGLGHLAALASGSATVHQARRLAAADREGFLGSSLGRRTGFEPERIDNDSLADAFREGDPWACTLVDRIARPLGQALAAIHLAVGVERFVIVGGFALALGPAYRNLVCDAALACGWDLGAPWRSMIELGLADDDAGLIGAGLYAARHASGASG